MGRLLLTLLLCSQNILQDPTQYLSLYFKTHRQPYYQLLNTVRLTGDWESWLYFFAEAVIETATQAVDTARQLMKLTARDEKKINKLERISGSAHLVHKSMIERPMASPNWVRQKTRLAPSTVNTCLRELERIEILKEVTGSIRTFTILIS